MDTFAIPDELAAALRGAHVVVLTGAGVSAESGVPTFRDAQTGLWARYSPESLATPGAFARDPRLVWEWYEWRRALVAQATPNPGHLALARLAEKAAGFTLVTQNVDGLHQQAGSRDVIELHGNLFRNRCSRDDQVIHEFAVGDSVPPRCPACGAHVRPDVVWFGENLPEAALEAAISAAEACEVFLSIGTSALVQPAASLPLHAASHGALLVEVNPEPTPLTARADYALRGPAGVVLPALVAAI